jgi:hypothetical protein
VPDPAPSPPPAREEQLRELRARIGELVPGGRVLAEDLLGLESRIDLLAAEPSGRAVLVLVAGEADGLALVGRALAQRSWVQARIPDWLQLAPELGLRAEAGVRALLVGPAFCAETRAAARALGDEAVGLACGVWIREGARMALLLRPGEAPPGRPAGARRAPAPAPRPAGPSGPVFRTGLSDADLELSRAELEELGRG